MNFRMHNMETQHLHLRCANEHAGDLKCNYKALSRRMCDATLITRVWQWAAAERLIRHVVARVWVNVIRETEITTIKITVSFSWGNKYMLSIEYYLGISHSKSINIRNIQRIIIFMYLNLISNLRRYAFIYKQKLKTSVT